MSKATQDVVVCPECRTCHRRSEWEGAPDREGKRCWRCLGTYVLVTIPAPRGGA
jgi:hypothetical protein